MEAAELGGRGPSARSSAEALVSYTMGKAGKRITVRLGTAGADLVRSDGTPKGPGDFLSPILDGYDLSTPERFVNASGSPNVVVNKYLKVVAREVEAAGTAMPARLTFQIARHTWADLARKSAETSTRSARGWPTRSST
jgi:hypothetical protein